MDDAHESPSDKGGETGESDETAAVPGDPGATDTDGIPEETDGDADVDLKEAAAEEGEVGRDVLMRLKEYPEIVLLAARRASVGLKNKNKRALRVRSSLESPKLK
uniref:TATA-box binding protein associated factor 11 n=1 Tax=Homo sapiens TaxID=9606 RepID=A0A8I5KXE9_HUMAN